MLYRDPDMKSNCPICETASVLYPLKCLHSYCKSCIRTYLHIKISEADVRNLHCPECSTILSNDLIESLVQQDYYKKYLRFSEIKRLEANLYIKWCPQPDCNGYDVASEENNNLICKDCGYRYCYICSNPWHHENKCKIVDDSRFLEWGKSRNMRLCPRCKAFVVKEGGCPQMKCLKCSFCWCWICGKDYRVKEHTVFNCYMAKNVFDFYWYMIIFFIVFPLSVPFWLFFMIVYKFEIAENFNVDHTSLRKYKLILYPLCFFLSPLVFTTTPIILLILFVSILQKLKNKFGLKKMSIYMSAILFFFVILLAIVIFVLILVLGAVLYVIGSIILPPLGILLLIAKLLVCTVRPKKFNYFEYQRSLN